MNPLDAIALLLLLVAILAGARAGFLGPVLGLIGAALGFGLAIAAASVLAEPLAGIEQPGRALVTIVGLGAFILTGEAVGTTIGAMMSHGLRTSPLRPLDAVGGGIVGAAHAVVIIWLVGGLLAAGLSPTLGPAARESVAIRITSERLPPPDTVAGGIIDLLDTTDLPRLFAGIEPLPAEPVELPADAEVAALAESAIQSTARVSSSGCGTRLSVGSGFFVNADHLLTNAHVVAGGTATEIRWAEHDLAAAVVAFDSSADLALLHVPGVSAPALQLSSEPPARGTAAAALGYPGGGDLAVTAAGVTATYDIGGPDIYGEGRHSRSVVELHGQIRHGNSGGPLVVGRGLAGGVVFGASRTSTEIGYAIGSDEALARIGPYFGASAAVDTGSCL